MKQVEQGGFSFTMLFTNKLFRTLVVSMCSTWLLYLFASILFLDPWHMATCFIQYLLLTPTYINILSWWRPLPPDIARRRIPPTA